MVYLGFTFASVAWQSSSLWLPLFVYHHTMVAWNILDENPATRTLTTNTQGWKSKDSGVWLTCLGICTNHPQARSPWLNAAAFHLEMHNEGGEAKDFRSQQPELVQFVQAWSEILPKTGKANQSNPSDIFTRNLFRQKMFFVPQNTVCAQDYCTETFHSHDGSDKTTVRKNRILQRQGPENFAFWQSILSASLIGTGQLSACTGFIQGILISNYYTVRPSSLEIVLCICRKVDLTSTHQLHFTQTSYTEQSLKTLNYKRYS